MSKYSKHLKDKAYRKMTKEVNRSKGKKVLKFSEIDGRSNLDTFEEWCASCSDELGVIEGGILSIAGSDGIRVTDTKVGSAPINSPVAVDQELEAQGYYEEGPVNMDSYYYHKPKMTYLEWFNKKYNTNY
jgi:hypothetical protein